MREALHTSAYWLMMVGAGLRQIATLGILVSIVPILELKGMGRQEAANLTGLMFGINFFSRLALGYMGDRWSKSLILAATLTIEALGFFALYYGDWSSALGITLVLTFIVLQGMGDGAGIIVWAAVGEYYGRDRFASLRGYITFSHSWALVVSPVYAGWVFDHFGNYDLAIVPGGICAGAAALCFLVIRKPPQLTRCAPRPDRRRESRLTAALQSAHPEALEGLPIQSVRPEALEGLPVQSVHPEVTEGFPFSSFVRGPRRTSPPTRSS